MHQIRFTLAMRTWSYLSPGPVALASSVGHGGGGTTIINGISSDNNQSSIGCRISLGVPLSHTVGVTVYACVSAPRPRRA